METHKNWIFRINIYIYIIINAKTFDKVIFFYTIVKFSYYNFDANVITIIWQKYY